MQYFMQSFQSSAQLPNCINPSVSPPKRTTDSPRVQRVRKNLPNYDEGKKRGYQGLLRAGHWLLPLRRPSLQRHLNNKKYIQSIHHTVGATRKKKHGNLFMRTTQCWNAYPKQIKVTAPTLNSSSFFFAQPGLSRSFLPTRRPRR